MSQKNDNKNGLLIGSAGGYGILKSRRFIRKGLDDIQDVDTLFHGTSKSSAPSIRKQGFSTSGKKGLVFTGSNEIGNVAKRNKGLVFFWKGNKKAAVEASKFAQYASKRGPIDISDAVGKAKIGFLGQRGSIIKAQVPRSSVRKNFIKDPENRKVVLALLQQQKNAAMHKTTVGKIFRKKIGTALSDRVATKKISKNRISGNLGLKKETLLTLKRIKKTAKMKPLQFAKGSLKLAAAGALVAAGAAAISKATGTDKYIFRRIRGRIVRIKVNSNGK